MSAQDPELSAALGWPGGISDPVLDRKTLLQMVAALRLASQQALEALEFMADEWGFTQKANRPERWRAITALRAALAQDSWQPIATAPQTGRKVILFYLNRNSLPRTVMARWLTDEQVEEIDGDGVGLKAGWYECIDNWDDYTEVAIYEGEPTHWMPLPAAPRKEEA